MKHDKNEVTFGTLTSDGVFTSVRVIRREDIMRCPNFILVPDHYNADGTCRCNDELHSEMKEWGFEWNRGKWMAPKRDEVSE